MRVGSEEELAPRSPAVAASEGSVRVLRDSEAKETLPTPDSKAAMGALPRSITKTLRFKLMLACALVATTTAAILGLVIFQYSRSRIEAQHDGLGMQIASDLAHSLGDSVEDRDLERIEAMFGETCAAGLVRYATAFDATGAPLASYSTLRSPPPSATELRTIHAASHEARLDSHTYSEFDAIVRTRRIDPRGSRSASLAEPDRRAAMVGSLRIGLSKDGLLAEIRTMRRNLALVVLVAALLAALVSIVLVRVFFAPLGTLVAATHAIGRGEFDVGNVELPKEGELAELSGALRAMSDALALKDRALRAMNADLEDRISERTQKLERALAAAHEAEKTRENILTCVSHELRTPLASVRAFAEILLHHPNEPTDVRNEFVSIILSESDRLSTLITNILDYVRFLSGEGNWVLDRVDLPAAAREAVARFAPLLVVHRMQVVFESHGEIPSVRCDREKILRALDSLLSNAIKFSPDGSTIEIRFDAHDKDVRLAIADHGVGIAATERDRIFERFHQAQDSLRGKPNGTGLGLPIAKEIVERHGGRIEVESVVGCGSTFRIDLPCDGPSEDAMHRTSHRATMSKVSAHGTAHASSA